jgi:hypothetical protein
MLKTMIDLWVKESKDLVYTLYHFSPGSSRFVIRPPDKSRFFKTDTIDDEAPAFSHLCSSYAGFTAFQLKITCNLPTAPSAKVSRRMPHTKHQDSGQHRQGFENIENPFVCERISMNSHCELDESIDRSNLQRNRQPVISHRVSRGLTIISADET